MYNNNSAPLELAPECNIDVTEELAIVAICVNGAARLVE
jgi:hypothetical protein